MQVAAAEILASALSLPSESEDRIGKRKPLDVVPFRAEAPRFSEGSKSGFGLHELGSLARFVRPMLAIPRRP